MNPFRPMLLVALLASLPSSAFALDWGLGSSVGLSSIHSEGLKSGSTTILSLPGNTLGFQPGLRVAVADTERRNQLFLDTGLFFSIESGSRLHVFESTANYQHTWWSRSVLAPFADLGGGLLSEGSDNGGATAGVVGTGIGVVHTVGHQHGTLRAEARVDHLSKNESVGRPALTVFGLRLGFDLWMR